MRKLLSLFALMVTVVPLCPAQVGAQMDRIRPKGIAVSPDSTAVPVAGQISTPDLITSSTPVVDVRAYGAVGDAKIVTDAVTTVSSTTITSASASFTSADVGKQFSATPTKYSTTGQLYGTISAVNSATSISVSITAGTATSSSSVRLTWGTDNTAAIQAAITYAQNQAKDGDPTGIFFSAAVPPVLLPNPATGRGYIVSAPLLITKEGVTLTGSSKESVNLILNSPTAQVNYTAPSGTFHTMVLNSIAVECNYIATSGILLLNVEENSFDHPHVDDCLTAAFNISGGGLNRFYDVRAFGNQTAFLVNNSNDNELIGANIFGQTGTSSTLNGITLTGTGTNLTVTHSWFEGLLNDFKYDNSAGTSNYSIVARNNRFLSTITEARILSASSANVNNQLTVNALFDDNTIATTNATHWADLLWNSNVAANTGINVEWEKQIRGGGPSGTLFNTDNASTFIVYQNNIGISGANISSGAGTVLGFDCGIEAGLGSACNMRGNAAIAGTLSATGNAIVSTNGLVCASAGGCNAGASGTPFFQVFTDLIKLSNSGTLLISNVAPTIATHFNTSGDNIAANGTASFTITVGTGAGTSTGVLTLPTATTAWNCWLTNQTRAAQIQQTASSTTSATFTNFGTTFAATNWTNSDVLRGGCSAN